MAIRHRPGHISEAAKKYEKEKNKISRGLTKLTSEVQEIEENKFGDHMRAKQGDVHPTEILFDEEITESIQNETGQNPVSWDAIRKNINFINSKPAIVKWEENKKKDRINEDLSESTSSDGLEEEKRKEQELAEYQEMLKIKKEDPLKYYSIKISKKNDVQKESV